MDRLHSSHLNLHRNCTTGKELEACASQTSLQQSFSHFMSLQLQLQLPLSLTLLAGPRGSSFWTVPRLRRRPVH